MSKDLGEEDKVTRSKGGRIWGYKSKAPQRTLQGFRIDNVRLLVLPWSNGNFWLKSSGLGKVK